MAAHFTVAIVGGGPNCLYVAERICARVRSGTAPVPRLAVEIFDAQGYFGAGCHYWTQPSTNHLNRAAAQISFGADETNATDVTDLLDSTERHTLHDWCRDKFRQSANPRYDVASDAWVERRLFGEASADVFDRYVHQLAAAGIPVTLRTATVTDIEVIDQSSYVVHADGRDGPLAVAADFVVLCTGHGETVLAEDAPERALVQHAERHDETCYVHHVYPIEKIDLHTVPPGTTVVCRGMGLAAIDFILWVTEGRGGRFMPATEAGKGLRYAPAGLEPAAILPFSDSGVFLLTRAINQKMNDASLYHQAVFFTPGTVDDLRALVGVPQEIPNVGVVRQLDFDLHVLPILRLEMTVLFYDAMFGSDAASQLAHQAAGRLTTFTRSTGSWHQSTASAHEFLVGPIDASARQVAESRRTASGERDQRECLFDWESLLDPMALMSEARPEVAHHAVLDYLRRDIDMAAQGNIDHPLKRAIDGVWRDLRATIRYVVEFGGLTARSHARFVRFHTRLTNRLAVGTSLDVMRKICALAEAGIVDLSTTRRPAVAPAAGGGYLVARQSASRSPRRAQVFVDARVHRFNVTRMREPLYGNLLRRGLVREWVNPDPAGHPFHTGGLDVHPGTHLVVRADGQPNPRMAALGPPTEGPLYFHLAAMRPYCADPVIVDADRVVGALFAASSPASPSLEMHRSTARVP